MTALTGFFRDSKGQPGGGQAIRPAVEIIARLSAERTRLREDVARLRDEVRRAPEQAELDRLHRQVERLRAERDALRVELAQSESRRLSREAVRQNTAPAGLASLVERLERAVARAERTAAPAPMLTQAPRMTQAPRQQPPRQQRATTQLSRRSPGGSGGGMLAGLVRENVQLRGSGETRREDTTPSGPAPRQTRSSGGVLQGLFSQNLSLRGPGQST